MYSPVINFTHSRQCLTNFVRVAIKQPVLYQLFNGENLRFSQNFHHDCTKLVRFKQRAVASDNSNHETENEGDRNVKSSVLRMSAKELLEGAATFQDQRSEDTDNQWATTPYPEGGVPRSQAAYALRPKTNPRETSVLLFPGEGSQFVGMGKDLMKFPSVRDIFECASEVVQFLSLIHI